MKTPVMLPGDYPGRTGPVGRGRPRKNLLSQMHRRAKGNARRFMKQMQANLQAQADAQTAAQMRCEIHPTYEGLRAPRSKAKGCTCRAVYEARKAATP